MGSSKGRHKRHAHKKKKDGGGSFTRYLYYQTCSRCGKLCYATRDAAKQAARVNHPGQVMHPYSCEDSAGESWWHLSSIPAGKLAKLREAQNRI